MHRDFADTAALLSDSARASILLALLDGRALPAGQLAIIAKVAPQTASSHLAKMVRGRLLTVEQQGRHRYYRLAGTEVAHALEALLAITPRPKTVGAPAMLVGRPPAADLAYARTCYSHLAGRLAVEIASFLETHELLTTSGVRQYALTPRGQAWFEQFGITIGERQSKRPRFARKCLDWTERRHHIAGELGSAMLARFRELKWLAPARDSRALRITLEGEHKFRELLAMVRPLRLGTNGRLSAGWQSPLADGAPGRDART